MIKILPNPEALRHAVAEFFVAQAQTAIQAHGRFIVALSGGNTPKPLYELLGQAPYREQIPWQQMHVFWGDERFVPADNPESNQRMARHALLDHVPISPTQIYPIPFLATPEASAQAYETTLHEFFKNNPPVFDLIFLGLGDNGHTASLFPNTPVLEDTNSLIQPVSVQDLNTRRITMTACLLNQAAVIAFLVSGNEKAEILSEVLYGPKEPHRLPAQLIQPTHGALYWFVDQAAAACLPVRS